MFFLKDNLIPGTFTPCYCDTDSMTIATCRTGELRADMTPEEELRAVFDPILRPERRQHWYDNWSKWFVLTREVEDEKFPGRFKSKFQQKIHNSKINHNLAEFSFTKGEFIALAPKTYCTYDDESVAKSTDAYKLGRKGIPHR